MKHTQLTNKEFLDLQSQDLNSDENFLLPHEQKEVDRAYEEKIQDFDKIIAEKVRVTGGDDWHDGAFRATDNAANIVTESMTTLRPYLSAKVVGYPELEETRVSLGSRAVINQNGYSFPVDIVGLRKVYPTEVIDPETDEEVTGVSSDSPLGKAILGKTEGEEIKYRNGDRVLKARIERINQLAVQEFFMDAANVRLEISES